ncbi:MAG: DUF4126 domain-containing protein [Phototrophicales bacterium]|nr:MAG: DUF4126 domain-containing protein [Phototrophicales bacterium]
MEAIATGLGLSSSAGLNAYLPLVIYNLAVHLGFIEVEGKLPETMASWEALGVFTILLIIEMIVDKVPLLDSVNDIINTAIRPATGAALMVASTSPLQENFSPELVQLFAIISGGTSAGGVHAVKALGRPLITGSTAGTGNFMVSFLEDVLALGVSLFAILLPFIILFLGVGTLLLGLWWIWELQRRDMVKRQYLR